jgi:hypothetical protein
MLLVGIIVAALVVGEAAGSAPGTCQVCTAAVTELIKRVPKVGRADVKDEDKAVAVAEAMENFCDNFGSGDYFEDHGAAKKVCKALLKASHEAIAASIQSGSDAGTVCASACEGVDVDARMPHYTPPPRESKKKAAKPVKGKGTVNDPKYKAALKKKAERDARRGKGAGDSGHEEL